MVVDFMKKPIAAAIRTERDFSTALKSDVDMVFFTAFQYYDGQSVHQRDTQRREKGLYPCGFCRRDWKKIGLDWNSCPNRAPTAF